MGGEAGKGGQQMRGQFRAGRCARLACTLHVAQKTHSAIDARTTRHAGYVISQRKRKLVEQVFGWMKTVGGLRKLRHRGGLLVDWIVTFAAAGYNLVRIGNLLRLA